MKAKGCLWKLVLIAGAFSCFLKSLERCRQLVTQQCIMGSVLTLVTSKGYQVGALKTCVRQTQSRHDGDSSSTDTDVFLGWSQFPSLLRSCAFDNGTLECYCCWVTDILHFSFPRSYMQLLSGKYPQPTTFRLHIQITLTQNQESPVPLGPTQQLTYSMQFIDSAVSLLYMLFPCWCL